MRLIRIKKLWRRDEGQALAEFALVLPILFLLIAGIIEFGRGWNIKQAVTDASRECARWAVVQDNAITTPQDVYAKAQDRLWLAHIDTTSAVTTDSLLPIANFHSPGQEITCKITTKYKMGFVGVLLSWTIGSSTVTITTSTTMRNEQ